MTVVTFRDGIMCADSRITSGSDICGRMNKIVRTPKRGLLAGGAGRCSDVQKFLDWCVDDCEGPLTQDAHSEWEGMVVYPNGSMVYYSNKGSWVPQKEKFYALGSGEPYALGAMAFGATAREAVKVACQYDSSCGLPIRSLQQWTRPGAK